jgi:hypothetical protein
MSSPCGFDSLRREASPLGLNGRKALAASNPRNATVSEFGIRNSEFGVICLLPELIAAKNRPAS